MLIDGFKIVSYNFNLIQLQNDCIHNCAEFKDERAQ